MDLSTKVKAIIQKAIADIVLLQDIHEEQHYVPYETPFTSEGGWKDDGHAEIDKEFSRATMALDDAQSSVSFQQYKIK